MATITELAQDLGVDLATVRWAGAQLADEGVEVGYVRDGLWELTAPAERAIRARLARDGVIADTSGALDAEHRSGTLTPDEIEREAWRLLLGHAESGLEDDIDEDGDYEPDDHKAIVNRALAMVIDLRAEHVGGR